jgi:hypothetical protein
LEVDVSISGEEMNISKALVEELRLYLKYQAERGDLEAQMLLAQIEQLESAPSPDMQLSVPDGWELGC